MQRRLLALPLLLALAACGGDREIVWTPVTAPDGSFKIEMPGKAELKSASLATPAGPAQQHVFVVQDDEHFYMAGYVEYPEQVHAKVGDRELLDTARDGAIERSRGKLLVAARPRS